MENKNIRLNLKKNIQEFNNPQNSENFEFDNLKIQKEAIELIAKTKKIMENLDTEGKLNFIDNKNYSIQGRQLNGPNISPSLKSSRAKKKSSSPPIKSLNKTYTQIHVANQNLDDENYLKSYNNSNMNSLQQRLLEKIKESKSLEKELKDKNSLIDKLHVKLDRKNDELTKLNEVLTQERSCNLKVEIATLNRKLASRDKQIEDYKKLYEGMVNELKNKITNLMTFNDSSVRRIKELETENFNLIEDNKKFEVDLNDLENNLNMFREKFDIEQKNKFRLQNEVESYEHKIKKLINMMTNLNDFREIKRKSENTIFSNMKFFFSEREVRIDEEALKSEDDGFNSDVQSADSLKYRSYSEYNQYRSDPRSEELQSPYNFSYNPSFNY
jgi:chromosome segregation ATPase